MQQTPSYLFLKFILEQLFPSPLTFADVLLSLWYKSEYLAQKTCNLTDSVQMLCTDLAQFRPQKPCYWYLKLPEIQCMPHAYIIGLLAGLADALPLRPRSGLLSSGKDSRSISVAALLGLLTHLSNPSFVYLSPPLLSECLQGNNQNPVTASFTPLTMSSLCDYPLK